MNHRPIRYCIHKEAPYYVAQTVMPLMDVCGFGASQAEAVADLREALKVCHGDGREPCLIDNPADMGERKPDNKRLNSDEAERVIMGYGFIPQRGRTPRHGKYFREPGMTVILPLGRPELPEMVLISIVRQTEMPMGLFYPRTMGKRK
ncbi:MAG: hypothetical protein PHV34_22285 [Verrucomicrobiae bacterium]|nr:hypothetical protein [Verrucomicrobiae bacterium]